MKTIALYKFFNAPEWLATSVGAVLPFVDNVLISCPQSDWVGAGHPEVPVLPDSPKVHKYATIQCKHQAVYEELLQKAMEYEWDYALIVDADEIWGGLDLGEALNLAGSIGANTLNCYMHSYIKSPFYRIMPEDGNKPTVLVKRGVPYSYVRWEKEKPAFLPVHLHHFSAVRLNLDSVLSKFSLSNIVERMPAIEWDLWLGEVWNRLPIAENVNPNPQYRGIWPKVKIVGPADLPEACLNNPLVKAWINFKDECLIDPKKITPELLKKYGLPADFSAIHIWFKQPSYRYKWDRMIREISEIK